MQKTKRTESNVLKTRIERLTTLLCSGMVEREETVAVALLAALCGQNVFLYGPPGTAKSLISRRIACAFLKPVYFECLMNRFSTPEEVFGPVSIKALKEDRYIRQTDAYLPKADIAFLDEIWKSSPAILNTLLTLINERIFKNGGVVEKVPLRALLAASNETPDANQGLEALFDRFLVRLTVAPVHEIRHFEQILSSKPSSPEVNVPEDLRVGQEEWGAWIEQIHTISLSAETLLIIHMIREQLAEQYQTLGVYVSDRRWQRAAMLMKAAAFFNGRAATNHSDALLLQHCLWTQKENHQVLADMVANAVKAAGIDSGVSLADIDRTKNALEREINDGLFYSSNVYETEKSGNDDDVFRVKLPRQRSRYHSYYSGSDHEEIVFLPYKHMKSSTTFHPLDQSGNEIEELECAFDGQSSCKVTENGRERTTFEPNILFHRGDKKANVSPRLVESLSCSVAKVRTELQSILAKVTAQFVDMEARLSSLFVPLEKTNLAIAGMEEQVASLKLRIKDCERLEALCS